MEHPICKFTVQLQASGITPSIVRSAGPPCTLSMHGPDRKSGCPGPASIRFDAARADTPTSISPPHSFLARPANLLRPLCSRRLPRQTPDSAAARASTAARQAFAARWRPRAQTRAKPGRTDGQRSPPARGSLPTNRGTPSTVSLRNLLSPNLRIGQRSPPARGSLPTTRSSPRDGRIRHAQVMP